MCCNRCGDTPPAPAPAAIPYGLPGMVQTTAAPVVLRSPFPWWLVLVIVLLLMTRKERK